MKYGEIVKQSNDFVDGTAYDQHQKCNLKRFILGKTKFKKGEEFDAFVVRKSVSKRGRFFMIPIKYPSSSNRGDKNLSWSGYLPYKYDKSSNTIILAHPSSGNIGSINYPDLPFQVYVNNEYPAEYNGNQIVGSYKMECDSSDPVSIDIGDGVKLVAYFERAELKPCDLYKNTKGGWETRAEKIGTKISGPQVVIRGLTLDQIYALKFKVETIS